MEHIREKLPTAFSIDRGIEAETLLPDIIRSCGDTLVEINAKAKEDELSLDLDEQDTKLSELNKAASNNLHMRRPMTAGITEETNFNQRIVLPSAKDASAFDSESDDETGYGEFDTAEEEISRDGIKRASYIIIASEERRKVRSRKHEDY